MVSRPYGAAAVVAAGLLALAVLAPGVLAGGARSSSFAQSRADCRSFGGTFSATTSAWGCSSWLAPREAFQESRGQRLFADCYADGGHPGATFSDPPVQRAGYPHRFFTPCLAIGG